MAKIPFRADVLQVLEDWKALKAIRTIELGHSHRMKEASDATPRIDESAFHYRDQERAHGYLFHLVEHFGINGIPATHELFLESCKEYRMIFPHDDELTPEEVAGAESLAWKAMRVGWQRAISGHEFYIEVKRAEVAA